MTALSRYLSSGRLRWTGVGRRTVVFGLLLLLALPAFPDQVQDVWTAVPRIVAVGDVHGDYGRFLVLLQSAGIADRKGNWKGGRSHFVQTGDLLDRGAESRKVMDLLMKLERQADRAGGRVHVLIGNHEAMNVYGDLRYVSAGEYAAFRTPRSEELRDMLYEQHMEAVKRSPPPEGVPVFDKAYREQWNARTPPGLVEHRIEFGAQGKYGKWIRKLNAVVKINDTLFLHGGISPEYAGYTIDRLNEEVRAGLDNPEGRETAPVADPNGPLWYRGLVTGDESTLAGHVEGVLKSHAVSRIVVGHTVTDGTVMPRFGGKVLAIDAGLSETYGGRSALLVIDNGKPYAIHRGTRLDIPGDSGPHLLEYLKRAASLDPQPSPLEKRIAEMEAGSR